MSSTELPTTLNDASLDEGIALSDLVQDAPTINFEREIKPIRKLFHLLSDATRLKVLRLLFANNEMHVNALCDGVQQSQPAVSHHLALMRAAGIIEPRRDGKHNYYSLVPNSSAWDSLQTFLNMMEITLPPTTSTPEEAPQS